MKPELIADYNCRTGEGPLWHPDEERLYWLDIPAGKIFRYEPATGKHEQCFQGPPIGGMTLQEDGSLLLFMADCAVTEWRDGIITRTIVKEVAAEREAGARFNDVIADPRGGVFCGTMATRTRTGHLYYLDIDGSLTELMDGIGVSNGLGFTPDRQQMYYTDTRTKSIYLFDYSISSGAIDNQRVFVKVSDQPGEGSPDGMTVDAEGFVWSARWGGKCLVRYAPDGSEDQRIFFPADKVSCVTFGGSDYKDMYVTTANPSGDKAQEGSGAGALFRINIGIQGVPEFRSKVCL
ncbi:MAG: SMP-30/gluconolactonase/LRE family protein [Anaerolineae bacterium]|nr:SMP-30/gluconolactonase/LRE family protein [Anaerolineae bacterium]